MAQKKESDTLRQRKHAQQEFLRLKKMQSGELDAGPKPSEVAVPLTFGEKLKNIWYHDKFALSAIAIIIVAITLLCVQCATKTVYDATVIVFTHTITGEPNCQKMGEYLTPHCPDLNGDGEININVVNCSINPKDKSDYSYTNRSKVQSMLATEASALLFITDKDSYEYLMSLSKEISLFEGEPLQFEEDFYEFCVDESGFFDTPKDLQISCRTIKGAAIEKDKNVDKYYSQAQAILDGLKNKN
ncbi:MAG: hypothetical protein E7521_02570 [Ruminococcaceae bacterium]|nr:hypothetical protein [Oscillospiraceae bacterium]